MQIKIKKKKVGHSIVVVAQLFTPVLIM